MYAISPTQLAPYVDDATVFFWAVALYINSGLPFIYIPFACDVIRVYWHNARGGNINSESSAGVTAWNVICSQIERYNSLTYRDSSLNGLINWNLLGSEAGL